MKPSKALLDAEVTMTMREFQEQILVQGTDMLKTIFGNLATELRDKPERHATTYEFAELLENTVREWEKLDLKDYME